MRTLTICGVNFAEFTIVLPSEPETGEKTAAEFLNGIFAEVCGVSLPISSAMTEHSIVIGSREADPAIKWDGFRTATDDRHLYLHGNIPRGTFYAVLAFAETYLGYRFFAVDCKGILAKGKEEVPPFLNIIDNPAFEVRYTNAIERAWNGEGTAFGRFNTGADISSYGGAVFTSIPCHTFNNYCPSELHFKEHPEYYSLVIDEETGEGQRISCGNDWSNKAQLCLSNPDVLRIVTENILNELRANPETRLIELSQCDNPRFCQCDACRRIDEEEGSHAGSVIRFVNAVAEAVEREFPNVLIQTFAYQYSRKPPRLTKARHNVIVRYCTIEACFRHGLNDPNCERNGPIYGAELAEWQKMADQISIWDYTTNYNSYLSPFPNLWGQFESVRFLADCHATHIFGQSGDCVVRMNGAHVELLSYLLGKLYWNPYVTAEEYNSMINEFLAAYYGKGWEEIRYFIDLEHETTAHCHMTCWEYTDIHAVGNAGEEEIAGFKRFMRQNYDVLPYQPVYHGSFLRELASHSAEILSRWDKAYDLAETEVQKMHVDRSRISVRFMELVMTEHDKDVMTPEERAQHEENAAQFLRDKKKYDLRYDIISALVGR